MSDYRDSYSLDVTKGKQAIGQLLQALEDLHAANKRGMVDAIEYEQEVIRLQTAIRKLEEAQRAAATATTTAVVSANREAAKVTAAVTTANTAAAKAAEQVGTSSKKSTQAVIEFSRGLQDFAAAGMVGATNNLQRLAETFAGGGLGGMGLVLGVTVAGLAIEQLFKRWDQLFPKAEGYATQVDLLKQKLEALEKNPAKVVIDGSSIQTVRDQLEKFEASLSAFKQAAQTPSEIEATQAAAARQAVFAGGGATKVRDQLLADAAASGKGLDSNMQAAMDRVRDLEKQIKGLEKAAPNEGLEQAAFRIRLREGYKRDLAVAKSDLEKIARESAEGLLGGALRGQSADIARIQEMQRKNPRQFAPAFGAIQDAMADRQRELAAEFERKKRDQQLEDEQQREMEQRAGEIASGVADAFMVELRKKILAGAADRELRDFIRSDLERKGVNAGEASIAADKMVEDERKRVRAEMLKLQIGGNFPEAQARERILKDAAERQAKAQDPDKAEREAERKKREAERDAAVGKVVGQFDQALGPKARLGLLQGGAQVPPVAAEAARQIQAQGVEPDLAAEAGRRIAENELAKLKADFAQRAAAGLSPEQAGAELIGQAQDANRKARGQRTIPQVVDQFDDVLEPQMQMGLLQGANPRMMANAAGRQMVRAGVDPQTAFMAGAAMMEQAMQKMEEQHARAMAAGMSERQAMFQLFQMVMRRQGAQEQMSKESERQLRQMGVAVRNVQGGMQMQGWGRAPMIWP